MVDIARKHDGALIPISTGHSLGILPARAALGSTLLYHGLQKLRDREGAGSSFEASGIAPGRPWATATALAETLAGALAIAGVLTRPAALATLVTQAVAVAKVHAKKGFDATKGGFEFNFALMGIAAVLLLAGPGHISVHRQIERAVKPRRRLFARRRRAGLLSVLISLLA